MEVKKSPKANLENYTKVFMLLGLLFALFVVYQGIEYKTKYVVETLGDGTAQEELEEEIPITQQQIEEVKPPPPPPPPAPEVIEVVEDDKDIEETVLESTETDEEEVVEAPEEEEIEEVVQEEEVDEEVPFAVIESVPTFPGCKGNNAKKKACFSKKMQKFIAKNFNADLAQDLGLSAGRKKIAVQFVIDKNGNVIDIKSRAPHPRLKKEAERVIKKLPKMVPGRQRNKPVKVRYNLPIIFNVEE